ncbi:hypothetical protein LN470_19480, partial [Xanthomonas phaseoli]
RRTLVCAARAQIALSPFGADRMCLPQAPHPMSAACLTLLTQRAPQALAAIRLAGLCVQLLDPLH